MKAPLVTYLFSSAMVIGALLWGYKATAILVTGDQPKWAFEVAPIFFAIGLMELASPRHKHPRRFTVLGYVLIVATMVGAVGILVWESAMFEFATGLPLLTLLVLGGSVARHRLWPGKWRYAPLALGLSVVPVIIIGGVLETMFGERYLEIPLLAHAIGWVFLSYGLVRKNAAVTT